jgi:hypothetical protein
MTQEKTMNDKDFQNVEGHMLPTTLPQGPTSEQRTDDEIRAELKRNEKLEAGTVRDAQGQIRNIRDFGKAPVESYAQYLTRTEGLVDFKALTEEQWRKETHQKTKAEALLEDLGITPVPPNNVLVVVEGIVRQAPTGPMSTEEVTALEEMLGLGLKPTTSANLGYASTQNDKPEGLKIEESDNIPCDATEQK